MTATLSAIWEARCREPPARRPRSGRLTPAAQAGQETGLLWTLLGGLGLDLEVLPAGGVGALWRWAPRSSLPPPSVPGGVTTGDILNGRVQAAQSPVRLQSQADLRAVPGPGRAAALGQPVSAPSLWRLRHLWRLPPSDCTPRAHPAPRLPSACHSTADSQVAGTWAQVASAYPAGPHLSACVGVPGS